MVCHLERIEHGSGIKDRDDKSSGIEILMAEAFAKINPTALAFLKKKHSRIRVFSSIEMEEQEKK